METKQLTQEQIAQLRAPLPAEAVSQHPTKAYLSTIKVIYIVERLNDVFGIQGWFVDDQFVEKQDKMVVVRSTMTIPEYGIVKSAFGGNDNSDLGDAYKGACTDALSKIASYLYIGMDVYKGLAGKPEKKASAAPQKPQPKPEPAKPSATSNGKIRGFVRGDVKQTDDGLWFHVDKELVFLPNDKDRKGLSLNDECELLIERNFTRKNKTPYCRVENVLSVIPSVEHTA